MQKNNISIRDMCFIGVFAAIISVLSPLSIPMPYGVPITLQTLIIPVAGIVLGARKGTIAVIIYILIGLAGLPVFSGFRGGFGVLFGPTGGFIISFPLMTFAAGIGAGKGKMLGLIMGLIIGSVINYFCGALIYSFVSSVDLKTAYTVCVAPFIPMAVIKVALSAFIGIRLKKVL